ncbi:MAG: hypothetical protein ABI442_11435 [Gemmatimonadaceae bacterium]
MADGTLTAYRGDTSSDAREPLWQVALPRYFEPPATAEEVRRLPWIQIGDLHKFVDVPQIDIGAFGPDGKLYAIRNTDAAWQDGRDLVFALQGSWQATGRHLEIYDRRGRRLGSYSLPAESFSAIRADGRGRIFLIGGKSVVIAIDPTVTRAGCQPRAESAKRLHRGSHSGHRPDRLAFFEIRAALVVPPPTLTASLGACSNQLARLGDMSTF